jgi:trans-2,3-dihydro-3-hydroxyanthranilate isomerase
MSHPIFTVDVFAEAPYGGNQLAVVLDAGDLTALEMQRIALETNYSETTFVTSRELVDGGYPVRIFTPSQELPFAGHPTLGTASVIRTQVATGQPDAVRLNLGVGQVPVTFEPDADGGELLWLVAPGIELGPECPAGEMAAALGLDLEDLESKAPVQQLSAGIVVVIVPLRTREALARCRLDAARYAPLRRQGFQPFVYVFCSEPESGENDLGSRFFFDANGVREDPATGSATACLGRYLLEHRFLERHEFSIRIEQGGAIGRPSLLMLEARQNEATTVIRVGGHVVPIMEGRLL